MALKPHYKHGLLLRAIAASLLLHALILLQPLALDRFAYGHAGPLLHALLVPSATPARTTSQSESQSALGGTASRRAPEREVLRVPHAAQESIPAPAVISPSVPPESANQADTSESMAAESPLRSPTRQMSGSVATTSDASTAPVGPAYSETKTAYLFALAAEARRVKRYPRRAVVAGWSGTAQISVNIALGGIAQAPELRQSSGYADIDQAALTMVETALKNTPVPENLKGQGFEFVLPVTFSLDER